MSVIKSFFIALAMYSKIPVPHTEWKEEDMKFVFVFFPFVGVVIGAIELGWFYLCAQVEGIPDICKVFIAAAIPIAITGGIHVDGFMDTMDAFHSYREREKKLEILKDPHIGAFSVIMLALYGLCFLAPLSFLEDAREVIIFCIIFVLSRCVSGFCAISFKSAKEGTLNLFAKSSSVTAVKIITIIEALICIAGMAFLMPLTSAFLVLTVVLTVVWYYFKTKKEFGGVTGDTAGYLLLILERNLLFVTVLVPVIFNGLNRIFM